MFIPLYLKSNLLLCIYYICMDVCTFCIRLFSVTMTTFDSFQLLFFGAQRRLGLANTTFPFNNSTLTDTITHTEHWQSQSQSNSIHLKALSLNVRWLSFVHCLDSLFGPFVRIPESVVALFGQREDTRIIEMISQEKRSM